MGSKHQLIKLTLTKSKCCLLVGVDRDNFKRNRKILPFAGCESVEKSSQAVATLWTPQAYDVVGLRILEFSSMSISTKPFSIRPFLVFAKRVIFIDFVSVQFWHTNTNHLFKKKKIYIYIYYFALQFIHDPLDLWHMFSGMYFWERCGDRGKEYEKRNT